MRLASFKVGSGSVATVLLHGFLGSGKNLRTVATKWSERDPSRVFLLPDLTGHGTSPPADASTELRSMGQDVLETARAEGLSGPLDLVGHSLGGRVSLGASLVSPDEVRSVVLLDIAPGPIRGPSEVGDVLGVLVRAPSEAKDRRELRAWLIEHGVSSGLSDWLMMNVAESGGMYRWRFDRPSLNELHVRVNREDLWAAVEREGAKVSAIRGGKSGYVTDEDVERLQRAGCHVTTLKEAGHFVHVDALDALLELLDTRPA